MSRNGGSMNKVRIITDSASDIINPARVGVTVVPMHITFGCDDYLDGVTLTHAEFYEKLVESDALPVTSLVSPADFEEEFERVRAAGDVAVVVTISSRLSGTYNSAIIAAEEYADTVTVVDSMNAATGEQILVQYAVRLRDAGLSAPEIAEKLTEARERIHIIGLLDTLEYLKKGGRISQAAAIVGGVLAIKPVVTITDGRVEMLGRARGSKNGSNFLIHEVERAGGVDFSMPFALGYTGLDDSMLWKYIRDSEHLWRDWVSELPVSTVGATIGTHIGPGAIVVAFFEGERKE